MAQRVLMNATEVIEFLAPWGDGTSWKDKCMRSLKNADPLEVSAGLVRRYGEGVVKINGIWDVWGIDFETCQKYCSRSNFPIVFDFPIFTSGVTNYLLPWLGLTAQLPYETGNSSTNFMSFCLAVGSPMLITFSLMSTALNNHWTTKRFAGLLSHRPGQDGHLRKAAKAARNVLKAAQQAPLWIHEEGFHELMNADIGQGADWWLALQRRLENTRRTVTFSLLAQTSIAVIAWAITILASYSDYLGIPTQALLLSSGTLWVWLIPVVIGWIFVRMQAKEDTVQNALEHRAELPDHCEDAALRVTSPESYSSLRREALWGDVRGDECLQGPAFNYARIFTYHQVVETIAQAYDMKSHHLPRFRSSREARAHSEHNPSTRESLLRPSGETRRDSSFAPHEISPQPAIQLHDFLPHTQRNAYVAPGDRHNNIPLPRTSNATTLAHTQPQAFETNSTDHYIEWKDLSSAWKKQFIVSNLVAGFLHWGIVGAAFIISFMTEVRGLSCYSGSYLIYGIFGFAAHISLVASVFLSHHSMLLDQREKKEVDSGASPGIDHEHPVLWTAAVLTRYLGKSFAVANAFWIILSSIFELSGMYESCWCTSSHLTWGKNAWIVLFVSAIQLRETAQGSWSGGIILSSAVAALTLAIVWRYSK